MASTTIVVATIAAQAFAVVTSSTTRVARSGQWELSFNCGVDTVVYQGNEEDEFHIARRQDGQPKASGHCPGGDYCCWFGLGKDELETTTGTVIKKLRCAHPSCSTQIVSSHFTPQALPDAPSPSGIWELSFNCGVGSISFEGREAEEFRVVGRQDGGDKRIGQCPGGRFCCWHGLNKDELETTTGRLITKVRCAHSSCSTQIVSSHFTPQEDVVASSPPGTWELSFNCGVGSISFEGREAEEFRVVGRQDGGDKRIGQCPGGGFCCWHGLNKDELETTTGRLIQKVRCAHSSCSTRIVGSHFTPQAAAPSPPGTWELSFNCGLNAVSYEGTEADDFHIARRQDGGAKASGDCPGGDYCCWFGLQKDVLETITGTVITKLRCAHPSCPTRIISRIFTPRSIV